MLSIAINFHSDIKIKILYYYIIQCVPILNSVSRISIKWS